MNGSKYLWGWMIAISVLFAAVLFYISYHISQVKEIPVGSGGVETAMSLIDQNLSIWIGIIAAICTILPVALSISQSVNFQEHLKQAREDMQESTREIEHEMDEMSERQIVYNLQSFVNTLSMNIKILSDWEELEVGQNPFLTSRPLLEYQLFKMVEYSSKCVNECVSVDDKLSKTTTDEYDRIRKNIKDNALDLLLLMNNLLKKYEVFFGKESLFELHKLMDEIWCDVETIMSDSTYIQVGTYIRTARNYCKAIQTLFLKQFAKE